LYFDISCSRFDFSVLVVAAAPRRCLRFSSVLISFSHNPGG
jgi:hypothetical protein